MGFFHIENVAAAADCGFGFDDVADTDQQAGATGDDEGW